MQNLLIDKPVSLHGHCHRRPPLSEALAVTLKDRLDEHEKSANSASSPSWNVGFASRCGNVRTRNEDYGVAFNCHGHQVIIVADGLGGLVEGHIASFLAVESAKQVILERVVEHLGVFELVEISSDALWTAGHLLEFMGDKFNLTETGLRTTLIILIANSEKAILTYIGDGAVYHYKSQEDCELILAAQKVNPGTLNLLSASLGPTPHGKAHSRVVTRSESDVFVVMTDGIADRINIGDDKTQTPQLIKEVIDRAAGLEGDLQAVTVEAVNAWTEMQDDKGYICNDNVSLGLIGNLNVPILLPSDDGEQDVTRATEDAKSA
jgi:PPM family protein phosphatase